LRTDRVARCWSAKATRAAPTVNAEADGRAAAEAVAAAVAPLRAIIETWSGELKAARDSNDTLREQVATAQAESAALKGKTRP
jgi:hypothetical protein